MKISAREKRAIRQRIKWVSLFAVILFVVNLTFLEDHNGKKILAFKIKNLWELSDETGNAFVLEFHTIETEFGPVKLRPFASVGYIGKKNLGRIYSHFSHSLEFEGQLLGKARRIQIYSFYRTTSPPIYVTLEASKTPALQFEGRTIYPDLIGLNSDGYDASGAFPDEEEKAYRAQVHRGLYFNLDAAPSIEEKNEEAGKRLFLDALTLSDGTVCEFYSGADFDAPEEGDWRLSSGSHRILLPNGEEYIYRIAFFEPHFGRLLRIITPEKEMIGFREDYSSYPMELEKLPRDF